jgi:hypothetical protein
MSLASGAESANALSAERAQEAAQQSQLSKEAMAQVNQRIASASPQSTAQQMATGAGNRESAWQNLNAATAPVASALPATSTGTSSPTGNAKARTATAGNAWNVLNSTAKANEGAYQDWQTQQQNADTSAKSKIGQIDQFAQQDAALQPTEQQVALQQGSALGAWGGVVNSLGQLATTANRLGAFGTATTPSVTPLNQAGNYPGTSAMLNGAATSARGSAANQNLYGSPNVWSTLFN